MELHMVMIYGYPIAVCTSPEKADGIRDKLIDEEMLSEEDHGCIGIVPITADEMFD